MQVLRPSSLYPLSQREADVLAGLMRGFSNKEIAKELGSSDSTVKVQVKAILRKLNVSSRTEAAVTCMRAALTLPCPRCGFIDGDDYDEDTVNGHDRT